MKYLTISNKGLLDVRLVSLMGGTTKRGNDYKIGRFGSGLKYALAWLVRNNVDFKIFIGHQEVQITTRTERIQGTDFDVLYIDGERTSISSSMGTDWEAWMIVREIFCNAIDEGDYERTITDEPTGAEDRTTFCLQLIDGIKDTVDNWSDYFLYGTAPLYETKEFAIYPPGPHLSFYKNGVLIHRQKESTGVFNYDIKAAHINELREYKGYAVADLARIIKQLDRQYVEMFLSKLTDGHYEYEMDYPSWYGEWAQGWKDAIGQAKIIAHDDLQTFQERGIKIDTAGLIPVPKMLFESLSEKFEGISAVRRADKVASFYETFDSELELQIKSALAILETCNYEVPAELNFIYGEFGDKSVFARINTEDKTVMYSTELKHKSRFMVCATIIEECEHFKTGHGDESRAFQQHFIDLFTKQLLERNEVQL